MVHVLVVRPLRVRAFYQRQGIVCDLWHPFSILGHIYRHGTKNIIKSLCRTFLDKPDAIGHLMYNGFSPTLIISRGKEVKELTVTKEHLFEKNRT